MDVDRVVVDALQVSPQYSGLGRQVRDLGRALGTLPVPLVVRCARETRPMLEPCFAPGTVFETPIACGRPRMLRILWQQLVAPFRDGRRTLLVSVGEQGPLWGRARFILVVNDVRRLVQNEGAGRAEKTFYRAVAPRAARRATLVATPSEFSRQEIERTLGVRARVVAQPLPDPPAVPRGETHFLTVGAARPYKGLETLAAASAQLRGSVPIVTAGAWDWVGEDELDQLYRHALAAVQPSEYEGYGLAVADAIAYGLPLVASDIPAHRELAAGAALYFPPGDVEALAEALVSICDDPELRGRLGAAARARADELRKRRPNWRELVLELIGAAPADDRGEREREDA